MHVKESFFFFFDVEKKRGREKVVATVFFALSFRLNFSLFFFSFAFQLHSCPKNTRGGSRLSACQERKSEKTKARDVSDAGGEREARMQRGGRGSRSTLRLRKQREKKRKRCSLFYITLVMYRRQQARARRDSIWCRRLAHTALRIGESKSEVEAWERSEEQFRPLLSHRQDFDHLR